MKPTASKTGLLLECAYAFRPDVVTPPIVENEAMRRGTRIHKAIETGDYTHLEGSDEADMAIVGREWLKRAMPCQLEPAYAWDGFAGMHLGTGREAYALAPAGTLLTGTADVLNDTLVGDFKTSERSARKALPQLLTLALVTGRREIVAIELRPTGHTEHHRRTVSNDEMAAHEDRLTSQIQSALEKTAQPVTGDHCKDHFCPLVGTCPAYQTAMLQVRSEVIPGSMLRRNPTAPIATVQDAAYDIQFTRMVQSWLDQKGDTIKEFVTAHGGEIRIDETHVYKSVPGSRTSVDAARALALAEKYGATEAERAACNKTSTFQSFKVIKKGIK